MTSADEGAPGRDLVRRLHPSSLLFRVAGVARSFLLPALLVWFFASEESKWEVWLALGFVPVLAASVLQYATLRYEFRERELVVRSGLVFRNERHVPYERIENVDLTRNPVHRALGVAVVRLDTASGDDAEAEFRVLDLDAVRELVEQVDAHTETGAAVARARDRLAEMRAEDQGEDAEEPEGDAGLVHALRAGELVRLGLISNRGLLGLAALLGIATRFDAAEAWLRESFVGSLFALLSGESGLAMALLGIALLVPALVLLSIAWTFLRYSGYRLELDDAVFRWSAGAWTHVSASIPRERVQKIVIRQTPLHRLVRRAAIRIETLGGREEEEVSSGRADFVPLARVDEAMRIAELAFPELEWPAAYSGLHPRAGARRIRGKLLMAPIVGLIASNFVAAEWAIAAALGLAFAGIVQDLGALRWSGLAEGRRAFFLREGWIARKWIVLPRDKVQVASLRTSPFDRRWGMVTLALDSAGAGTWDPFELDCVDRALVGSDPHRGARWGQAPIGGCVGGRPTTVRD